MSERQVEVVCENCSGEGKWLEPWDHSDVEVTREEVSCDNCAGTGYVSHPLRPGSRDALLLAWADARQEMNRVISAGEHWSFIEDATKAYEVAGAAIVAFDLAAHDTKEERDG